MRFYTNTHTIKITFDQHASTPSITMKQPGTYVSTLVAISPDIMYYSEWTA